MECACARASLETSVSLRCFKSKGGNCVGDIVDGVVDELIQREKKRKREREKESKRARERASTECLLQGGEMS